MDDMMKSLEKGFNKTSESYACVLSDCKEQGVKVQKRKIRNKKHNERRKIMRLHRLRKIKSNIKHLKTLSNCTLTTAQINLLSRGLKFIPTPSIPENDIYACQQVEDFHVKARCYRSLRKSAEPHFLAVIFRECEGRAEVFKAHCSCKGGSGGHCNHVFALLLQLNGYSCSNIQDIPSDATCTSLPQSWHTPRATSICPLPVMGTHYARSETDRNGERSRDPVRCKLFDARGPALRYGLQRQHVMDQVVHLNQKETAPPFSYLLSDQEPGLLINTVFGNLPLGACLSYQLQDYGRPNTTFLTNYSGGPIPRDSSVPRCLEFPDIPHVDVVALDLNEIQALDQADIIFFFIIFFVHHVLIDLKEAHA